MERNSPNQISVSILLMDVSTIFSIWKIQGAPHTSIVEVGRASLLHPSNYTDYPA
jgi:hypothetical protein